MKYQCYLCKALKKRSDVEMKEISQKGLLVYVCKYGHEVNQQERRNEE